jgi:hypothetical protein
MNELSFAGSGWEDLKAMLLAAAPNEAAAFLLAGPQVNAKGVRLLVREVIVLSDSDVLIGDGSIAVTPEATARALKRARNERLSLVLVHTHPFSGWPMFSAIDDQCERELFPAFFSRAPQPHGTLVIGTEGYDARVHTPGAVKTIERLTQIGRRRHQLSRDPLASDTVVAARWDRNVRALGREGQAILGGLRVGVIGLGGVGSIVAQQLAYLGVGKFVLLDFDHIDESNLNRVVGATSAQVGLPKVDVAESMIKAVNADVLVETIKGDAGRESDARRLLDCDVLMLCTDSHGSRAVINQLAYQYYIPTIDMGLIITAPHDAIMDVAGRVQLLAPTLPCLVCQQLLDSEQVRRDLLSDAERRADQYIVGSMVPAPAVISLNGVVASLATTMLLAVLANAPFEARHQIYRARDGAVRPIASIAIPDCVICSRAGALGRGDTLALPWRRI